MGERSAWILESLRTAVPAGFHRALTRRFRSRVHRAPGEPTFKVALHAYPKNKLVFEPRVSSSMPNPELRSLWVAQHAAHGWSVPTARDVPDVAVAVEFALAYGRG
jgi:hypothetical protein